MFEFMGNHPFLTGFLALVIYHTITESIANLKGTKEPKENSEED